MLWLFAANKVVYILGFAGNPGNVTLGCGLGLRLTFYITPDRTVLRSDEDRVITLQHWACLTWRLFSGN